MRFELTAAVLVAAGVVEGDTALPELRRLIGNGLRHLVERRGRFGKAPLLERAHRAIHDRLRALLCRGAERRRKNQDQHSQTHVPHSLILAARQWSDKDQQITSKSAISSPP